MKRTFPVVLGVAGALLVTAGAGGATNTLSGAFSTGGGSVNQNAFIEMQIKTKANGKPKSVKNIEVGNLGYDCINAGTIGEVSFAVPGSFKVRKDDTTDPASLNFVGDLTEGDVQFEVFGRVSKKGNKVLGSVYITFGTPPESCGNWVGAYTAKE